MREVVEVAADRAGHVEALVRCLRGHGYRVTAGPLTDGRRGITVEPGDFEAVRICDAFGRAPTIVRHGDHRFVRTSDEPPAPDPRTDGERRLEQLRRLYGGPRS